MSKVNHLIYTHQDSGGVVVAAARILTGPETVLIGAAMYEGATSGWLDDGTEWSCDVGDLADDRRDERS